MWNKVSCNILKIVETPTFCDYPIEEYFCEPHNEQSCDTWSEILLNIIVLADPNSYFRMCTVCVWIIIIQGGVVVREPKKAAANMKYVNTAKAKVKWYVKNYEGMCACIQENELWYSYGKCKWSLCEEFIHN